MTNRTQTILAACLLALCGTGLMLSWIPNDIPWHAYQVGVFALLAIWAIDFYRRGEKMRFSRVLIPLAFVPVWGAAQLLFGWTVYPFATEHQVLRWITYLAVFLLSSQLFQSREQRDRLLRIVPAASLAIAVLSLIQYFTSSGTVFWIFQAEQGPHMGPFLSHDHFCSFLAIGLAMSMTELLEGLRFWPLVTTAFLYAAGIASASRAGSTLLTLEILFFFVLSLKARGNRANAMKTLGAVGAAVTLLVMSVGTDQLIHRFQDWQGYPGRLEYAQSSVAMFLARPITGYGLGTWTEVYPEFAVADDGLRVNAAHNDWLQWLDDGGVLVLAGLMMVAAFAVFLSTRNLWAAGSVVVFLHSLIDFPLQGRFLPTLVLLVLGAASAASLPKRHRFD